MSMILNEVNKLAYLIAPLFYKLLAMSLAAACIGLVILLIRALADKKITPVWKYAMWSLVLIALMVPYRPQSKAAVLPVTPVEEISYRAEYDEIAYEVFLGRQDETLDPVVFETMEQKQDTLFWKSLVTDVLLPLGWLGGAVAFSGIFAASAWNLSRKLKRFSKSADSRCEALLAECRTLLGIRQEVKLIVQNCISSPAVIGLSRCRILLPDYVDEMDEEQLRFVLLHELSHWKRKDTWINTLLIVLQSIYWFNPLIWVLFRSLREDMELLNDAYVLDRIGEHQGKAYSLALVEVLARSNRLPLAPKLLCMCEEGKNLQRRISMIKLTETFKKNKMIISVVCILLIGGMALLFLTRNDGESFESNPGISASATVKPAEPTITEEVFLSAGEYYDIPITFSEDASGETGSITVKIADATAPYDQLLLQGDNVLFSTLYLMGDRGLTNYDKLEVSDTYTFRLVNRSDGDFSVYVEIDVSDNTTQHNYTGGTVWSPVTAEEYLSAMNSPEIEAWLKTCTNENKAYALRHELEYKGLKRVEWLLYYPNHSSSEYDTGVTYGLFNNTVKVDFRPVTEDEQWLMRIHHTDDSSYYKGKLKVFYDGKAVDCEVTEVNYSLAYLDKLIDQDSKAEAAVTQLHFPAEEIFSEEESLYSKAFVASLQLPEGWSIREGKSVVQDYENHPQWNKQLPPGGTGFASAYLYAEGREDAIGWLFVNNFDPDQYADQMTFPNPQYYQTVFPDLRLSSYRIWDPFTSVKTTDSGEAGICNIWFHDIEYIAAHPNESLAFVPTMEALGVWAYDVDLKAYLCIGFAADSGITEEQCREIAKALVLEEEIQVADPYEQFAAQLNGEYASQLLAAVNARLESHKNGSYKAVENHHPPYPQDFPLADDITLMTDKSNYIVAWNREKQLSENSVQEGFVHVYVPLDHGSWICLEPALFDGTTLGFANSSYLYNTTMDSYGYPNFRAFFESHDGYYGEIPTTEVERFLARREADRYGFQTSEAKVLDIARKGVERYFEYHMGDDVPDWYRITSYKINDIELFAYSGNEFAVAVISDYGCLGKAHLSASGSFAPNGNEWYCTGDYREFRFQIVDDGEYIISGIGIGGVGAGLTLIDRNNDVNEPLIQLQEKAISDAIRRLTPENYPEASEESIANMKKWLYDLSLLQRWLILSDEETVYSMIMANYWPEEQTTNVPLDESALSPQQQELVNLVKAMQIGDALISPNEDEAGKGQFIRWLINRDEFYQSHWDVGGRYEIPLSDIQSLLSTHSSLTSIDPVRAFGPQYNAQNQCLQLDMLGGYGGALAHGLISIEEQGNTTSIVLGIYDTDTFWNTPPVYTLIGQVTAVFETENNQWRIMDSEVNWF